jgi:hypothetical protein
MPLPLFLRVELWLLYGGSALWGLWRYRNAGSRTERYLFASIPLVAALVLATEILASLEPHLAKTLHHPVGTVLGLLMAALVIMGCLK